MHHKSPVGSTCLCVSAVKAQKVQIRKLCVASTCGFIKKTSAIFFANIIFASAIPSSLCLCVSREYLFSVAMRRREQWKASVALASKNRNKEAETHCWSYQSYLLDIIQLGFLFFVFCQFWIISFWNKPGATVTQLKIPTFQLKWRKRKKKNQPCNLLWCFLCLLCCPSEVHCKRTQTIK